MALIKRTYVDQETVITAQNLNDIQDEIIGNSGSFAAEYDATATYAVGDYCKHGGNLYKCNVAISSAESWTAEHWDEVTVGGQLQTKKNRQTPVTDPTASGTTLSFIDSIEQNANGEITPTKKSVTTDSTPTANSTNPVQSGGVKTELDKKVDKVQGKGLSTEDYTTEEKNKLSGIASNAEVNVQSDWSVSDVGSDAYIKNKPANLVQDANYVHTDNNYTSDEKSKLSGIATGAEVNVQADWSESDSSKDAYIKSKPTLGTAAAKDVPATGDASSGQVVLGSDSRLSDARNAADVYSWAKASTKPSYTASEVGAIPSTDKGAASGVAELDANGKVPAAQLPSYVDDVIEGYLYNGTFYEDDQHTTAITPESGKIYVDLVSENTYRWGGSAYAEISESLALGETSVTAYRGDRGKIAYDDSQTNKTNIGTMSSLTTTQKGTLVGAINEVDANTYSVMKMISQEYDSTAVYAKGSYCSYQCKLYKSNVLISTPEAWTAAHWDEVHVTDVMGSGGGGGGGDASSELIAEQYDQLASYAVGDYCINLNVLYKCNTAIPTGGETWNAAHWDECSVATELETIDDRLEDIDEMSGVAVQTTAPTGDIKMWLDTDANPIILPEIDDEHVNGVDTWSSNKVNNELNGLGGDVGIVVEGKRPKQAVTAGQYVIVRNSTITGITDGLYTADNALSTSADVSASDLTAVSDGGLNSLKNSLQYNGFKMVSLESYSSSNPYYAENDGIVTCSHGSAGSGRTSWAKTFNASNAEQPLIEIPDSMPAPAIQSTYVKKGTPLWGYGNYGSSFILVYL